MRTAHVEYKRPLSIGERFIVRTWVDEMHDDGVKVQFEIVKKSNAKISADGYFNYTMVSLATGRAEKIPDWIAAKYSV